MALKRDWSMNSPYWLTVKSENFEKGDVIRLLRSGIYQVGVILSIESYYVPIVQVLTENDIVSFQLGEYERKLVSE